MECVINKRLVKYEDGELYWWKTKHADKTLKRPVWFKLKQSNKDGYKVTMLNYKQYKVHRLIYKLHNPDWDIEDNSKNNEVDHIDINRSNNNIENLRILKHQQNQWNNNGRCYRWLRGAYQVQIVLNGKSIYGGRFKTEEEAIEKRDELKQKYHSIN